MTDWRKRKHSASFNSLDEVADGMRVSVPFPVATSDQRFGAEPQIKWKSGTVVSRSLASRKSGAKTVSVVVRFDNGGQVEVSKVSSLSRL